MIGASITEGLKLFSKLYYKIFPTYEILEIRFVNYWEGDRLIKESSGKPESEQWDIAKEEDTNRVFGMVYVCRKKRITT